MNQIEKNSNMARVNIKRQSILSLFILGVFNFLLLAGATYFIYKEVLRTRLSNQALSNTRIQVEHIAVLFHEQAKNRKSLFLKGHQRDKVYKYRATINDASKEIYSILSRLYDNQTLTQERKNALMTFEQEHKNLMEVYNEAVSIFIQTNDAQQADSHMDDKGRDVGNHLAQVRSNIDYNAERLFRNSTVKLQETIISVLLASIILFVAVTFAVVSKILLHITRVVKFSQFVAQMSKKTSDAFATYRRNSNDEIGDMIESFNEFADTIAKHQTELSTKLAERTAQLEASYGQVIEHQEKVQAEKVASLGQLIAGIAHELNTPAGVIYASSASLAFYLDNALQSLLKVYPLLSSSEQREKLNETLVSLIHKGHKSGVSSLEQRATTQALLAEFAKILPNENKRKAAQELSLIGFDVEMFESIKEYYLLEDSQEIHNVIVQFGKVQLSASDIGISISRITYLVKTLKSYSNSDAHHKMAVDLSLGIGDTLVILRNKLQSNTTVHTTYSSKQKVLVAPEQLNQVWTNIINNAIQAMNGPGTLDISVGDIGANVVTTITDTGPGIPEEIQSQIFEPYFTTKKRGEGVGIGLHICRNIVQEHGGDILLTSSPKGTTFTITLPAAKDIEIKIRS